MAFYQELLQHGQQPLLRSKLLLVGPGRAGKTSLLRRLTRQAFIEGQASTSGIDVDVHLWQQSSGSGEQMEAGSEFTNAAVRAAVDKLTEKQRPDHACVDIGDDDGRRRLAGRRHLAGRTPLAGRYGVPRRQAPR